MTDPGVKMAAACSVLLAGILLAWQFRRDAPKPQTHPPGAAGPLALGQGPGPGQPRVDPSPALMPFSGAGGRNEADQRATILRPTDSGQPPPESAEDYPDSPVPTRSRWGSPMELPTGPRQGHQTRMHTIVDGDTLPSLAARYLGSTARSLEIYEANRDVLSSTELLPIGVRLRIPAFRRDRASPGSTLERLPLPVPRRVGGQG